MSVTFPLILVSAHLALQEWVKHIPTTIQGVRINGGGGFHRESGNAVELNIYEQGVRINNCEQMTELIAEKRVTPLIANNRVLTH